MRIALIYPRITQYYDSTFRPQGYLENMSGYPPLSLAYVAALINNSGHQAVIIDANILNWKLKQIVERIKEFGADATAFTLTIPTFYGVLEWITAIKKYQDIPVIVGGSMMKLYPKQVMQHQAIDYGVIGNAVGTLPDFLDSFMDKSRLDKIPGLCFRRDGDIIVNSAAIDSSNISRLPFPERRLLNNKLYYSPLLERKNFTSIVGSQGCLFKCRYCSLPGDLFLRSADDILDEISQCYHEFGVREIDFYDSIFTADKQRVYRLCAGIKEKGLDISWRIRTHLSCIDNDLLKVMYGSGCKMVMYGIESFNSPCLEQLGRPRVSFERTKEVIRFTRNAGIMAFGFFMLGLPGQGRGDILKDIELSRQLGLDFVHFTQFTMLPDSELYHSFLRSGGDDYWRRFIEEQDWTTPPQAAGVVFAPDVIGKYVSLANRGFYLRLSQIVRLVFKIKSFKQFLHYIRSGMNMLLPRIRLWKKHDKHLN